MTSLELVDLPPLMRITAGSGAVIVAMVDGPVAVEHPELLDSDIQLLPADGSAADLDPAKTALRHGTFVAGILAGRRGGAAAAICPGCHLIVRPIFTTTSGADVMLPRATPETLAEAICECVDAGARVLNLSVSMAPSTQNEQDLRIALDHAARRGAIVVAATGNQGALGSTSITRHPAVIPVVGYRQDRRPMAMSNLGASAGKRGLGAPGSDVTSIGLEGTTLTLSGTSVAAPFVTGAIALLWSRFPDAPAGAIRRAVSGRRPRRGVVPPLLDGWAAYQALLGVHPAEVVL